MISVTERVATTAEMLGTELVGAGFGGFYGTPCGILSPLYLALQDRAGLMTVTREDNAVGLAAGAALAGRCPVVLMQNSGLGQCVNALASLVSPYRIPMLLVVSLRGVHPDPTPENTVMGRLTAPLLRDLGIHTAVLTPEADPAVTARELYEVVRDPGRPAALLIPPDAFGWRP
ncbi:thiamine pyrophosphate-binding protein [Micromonospora sp. NPDC050980]|uniref:thiamine pyrophosphate-binding protein n=1 Tax=Micromonospora sp. NPDC050980 TaxID=3155161 RepID=UPI00340F745D